VALWLFPFSCFTNSPYSDWSKVSRKAIPGMNLHLHSYLILTKDLAPLPRDFLTTTVVRSPVIPANADFSSREQCFSPRVSAFGLGDYHQSFSQAAPQFLRSPFVTPRTRDKVFQPPLAIDRPVAHSTVILSSEDHIPLPNTLGIPEISVSPTKCMDQTFPDGSRAARMADFWDSLDREDQLSTRSEFSALSSNTKVPFSRTWNLRKERSLILIYSHRLLNLSTTSIQQKLRRRPKSVAGLKCTAYAQPIADLPSGLSQIGSGIGFTHKTPLVNVLPPVATPSAPTSSAPTTSKTAVSEQMDPHSSSLGSAVLASDLGASRTSMSSEYTVDVPKACHGLFRSLSISSFWTGFMNGSVGLPVAVNSSSRSPGPMKDFVEVDVNLEHLDVGNLNSSIGISDPGPEGEDSEDKGDCPLEMTQPLAESTAFLSPGPEAFSPTLSIASSIATEEEALTPDTDTVDFRLGRGTEAIRRSEEIVEMKRSEEAYHLVGPESTLRLVTPMNGLRLAFADGLYSS
jgi:serum/glucocorticoid-regulated kinase 2